VPNIYPGDPAPWFTAPTRANPRFVFSSVAGRYVVLMFVPAYADPAAQGAIKAVMARRKVFNDDKVALFGVTGDAGDVIDARIQDSVPGIRWFFDPQGEVRGLYDGDPEWLAKDGGWFLIDPSLRIMALGRLDQTDGLIDYLEKLPVPDLHAGTPVMAPVLIAPRIFEPEFCKQLIEFYDREGGAASGFMREVDGKTVAVHDESHKRRSDVLIEEEDLKTQCRLRIVRRLTPEVKKAFQFEATRMERYLIACYEDRNQGMFRPHRDNTTSGTAHRKFAVSLNLNAEDYEGGDLRFPEFGQRTYRPPTGGAVVFSCSLLHEATPVTKGRRFVFVPFLYDEAGARVREANMQFVDPSIQGYKAGLDADEDEGEAVPAAG
jgi:predicted 2-oxoglutarate/Fe(II)-dependent dioxygenase YbiX/peroxiredoxin